MISYEEFKKVEIRAGKIISAEKIPDTDKLLKLMVDFNEKKENLLPDGTKEITSAPRQIVSGIALHFPDPAVLVGKTCMFVTNLEPRKIRGLESHGMLFAVSSPVDPSRSAEPGDSHASLSSQEMNGLDGVKGGFSLLEPNSSIFPGSLAA